MGVEEDSETAGGGGWQNGGADFCRGGVTGVEEEKESSERVESGGVERDRVEGVGGKHRVKREGVRRGSEEVDAC